MSVLAWHFVADTLRDGSPIPADGEWLVYDGPVVICESGLYASEDAFDALTFAPGPTLCRVECDDVVDKHKNKFVCRRRRIIARRDATEMLRQFARDCALDVIHLWDAPEVVVRYLKTGDEAIRGAAEVAAMVADDARSAEAAEWAARAASSAACAASSAAWAASSAAWAARAAQESVMAAYATQRTRFNFAVNALFGVTVEG